MILIYTDGACKGNPGPGGWGLVAIQNSHVEERGGGETHTTNNRMELQAVIEAVREFAPQGPITLCSDSNYVIQGIRDWLPGWKRKGWRTAAGKPVLNQDLWVQLDSLSARAPIQWQHVAAHCGIPGNERADQIASAFASNTTIPLYQGPLSGSGIADLSIKPPSKIKNLNS